MKRFSLICMTAIGLSIGSGARADEPRINAEGTVKVRVKYSAVVPGGRLVADYGGFAVYSVPLALVEADHEILADDNKILLSAGVIDTTIGNAPVTARSLNEGQGLHLVQFAGPVRPEWIDQLRATGVRVVSYVPSNAYLVYGDGAARSRVIALRGSAPHVQWESPYLDEYKIQPGVQRRLARRAQGLPAEADDNLFAIQMVRDEAANARTLELIERIRTGPVLRKHSVLNYLNVVAHIPVERIAEIPQQPEVVSIHAYSKPKLFCERQDMIVAGQLSGAVPTGPGYLAWLAGKGFTQGQFDASGLVVDVTDSGIDNGTTSPNHFGLWSGGVLAGTSHVSYNRLEGTPNGGSTLKGCDGHGNLNSHIIGGFDDSAGFPFEDASGFHFGLGVCPFVRVGSSVIFDSTDYTNPNFTDIQSRAYHDAARISSNSWGDTSGNSYTAECQEYDALVRDAQPAGSAFPTAGNQEMVIVFAAGNDGPQANTVAPPATAKNIITVGAGENVQSFGGSDSSGVDDTGANSANDIISFSSRGPTSDGRKKPDVLAPGTHVSGGVVQAMAVATGTGLADACFDGLGVSGGVGSNFFPSAGQEFYTASSGTSHACPAVSGACALVRQFFINQGQPAPSAAMTKAFLMNSARYMTGVGGGGTLWSNIQGMGAVDLGDAFDRIAVTPTILSDQEPAKMFTATGQTRIFQGNIADVSKPFRVTLVWTDAPGNTFGSASNNDLNLTVTAGCNTYLGNVFSGAFSTTGGSADARNNAESVFLPVGTSGAFSVTVTAANINSDGVPNVGGPMDQDFALVIYNAGCTGVAANAIALPSVEAGQNYPATVLTASGGTGTYTWSSCGGLPGGLMLASDGTISGTATTSGTFAFIAVATDGMGCSGTLSTSIVITDATLPVIHGCPGNLALTTDSSKGCSAVASWAEPTATDNSTGVGFFRNDSAPANGGAFPIGTTTVSYLASDLAGNKASCTFTVTVTGDSSCDAPPAPPQDPQQQPQDNSTTPPAQTGCGAGGGSCGSGAAGLVMMLAPVMGLRRRRSRRR